MTTRRHRWQKMLVSGMVAFVVVCYPLRCGAQEESANLKAAYVTFYSTHVTLTGGLPGRQPGAFAGNIFIDDSQLAHLKPGRFVTFAVPPGLHVLTATSWMNAHAANGAHVTLDLKPGHSYFLQAMTRNNWVGAVWFELKEMFCSDVDIADTKIRPLEEVHITANGSPLYVTQKSFPSCQEQTASLDGN